MLCLTETFLDDKVNFNFSDAFDVYRCDRSAAEGNVRTRRASGVAILVHKSIHSSAIELDGDTEGEFTVIKVKLKPMPLIIYCCYMSVFELNMANKHYDRIKQLLTNHQSQVLVVGDFNLKKIVWEEDEHV